jgi:hypothetical protein
MFQFKGNLLRKIFEHDPASATRPESNGFHFKNWFQAAALAYSDRLSRDRLAYRDSLGKSQYNAGLFQIAIAVASAVATILIGIKSIWQSDGGRWLRFFGIAFGILALSASATVTAMTSLSSYFGDQDAVTRNLRTVAQLRQLHWRVLTDVLSDQDLCTPEEKLEVPPTSTPTNSNLINTASAAPSSGDDNSSSAMNQSYTRLVNKVIAWKQRHEEILNEALPPLAKPGDLARAGDNTNKAGEKPPQQHQ